MQQIIMNICTTSLPVALGYILRVQLIEYHDRYVALGHIPSYALENFIEMYNAYHDLGGNGMVTEMYKEVLELEIRK